MTMITVAAYASVASAALGVVGSIQAGNAAKDAANARAGAARKAGMSEQAQAAMDEAFRYMEADDMMMQAHREADAIKRQATIIRSAVTTQQGASGVVIGEGSAAAQLQQVDALSSADALVTLYSGINKSVALKSGARMSAEAGRNKNEAAGMAAASYMAAGNAAQITGFLQAGSIGLGAGAKYGNLLAAGKYAGSSTNPTAANYENQMDRGVKW